MVAIGGGSREGPPSLGAPWPRALLPFKTAKTVLFRLFWLFSAFPWIQAALAYCTDQKVREVRKWPEWPLSCFSSLRGPLVPLDPVTDPGLRGPTPGRLNWPVLASSGFQAAILLVLWKWPVLVFSCFLEFYSRKP